MKRICNRLAQMFVTLIGVSFITFCLAYLAPGDPVAMLLESADTIVSEEVLEKTRKELGLDKPFLVQYGNCEKTRRRKIIGRLRRNVTACVRDDSFRAGNFVAAGHMVCGAAKRVARLRRAIFGIHRRFNA